MMTHLNNIDSIRIFKIKPAANTENDRVQTQSQEFPEMIHIC